MQDRVPTPGQEGRVLISPENGSAYYAKIEMADNPTQDGTPLNKSTLLNDSTATAVGLTSDDPTVNDAFIMLNKTKASGWVYIGYLSNFDPMSGTWTALDPFNGHSYDLGVYMIGGGGGGGLCVKTSSNSWAAGGASGYGKNFIIGNVTPGTQFSYVIGAGGAARTTTSAVATGGNSGGTTSFNNVSVSGGMGGKAVSNNAGVQGSSGGQGSDAGANIFQNNRALYGCCQTNDNNAEGASGGLSQSPREGQNQFDPNMITLSAGGFANGYMGRYQTILAMPSGAKGGNGSINGEDATGYGNGGGAGVSRSSQTRKSGAGSDGVIFLYARIRRNS